MFVTLGDEAMGTAGAGCTTTQRWTCVVSIALTLGVTGALRTVEGLFASSLLVAEAILMVDTLVLDEGLLILQAAAEASVVDGVLPILVLTVTCSSEVAGACCGTAPWGLIELVCSSLLGLPRAFSATKLGEVKRLVSTSCVKEVGVFRTTLLGETAVFSFIVLLGSLVSHSL